MLKSPLSLNSTIFQVWLSADDPSWLLQISCLVLFGQLGIGREGDKERGSCPFTTAPGAPADLIQRNTDVAFLVHRFCVYSS